METTDGLSTVYRTWFIKVGSSYRTDLGKMPTDAQTSWFNYCHYMVNPAPETVLLKMQTAEDMLKNSASALAG